MEKEIKVDISLDLKWKSKRNEVRYLFFFYFFTQIKNSLHKYSFYYI